MLHTLGSARALRPISMQLSLQPQAGLWHAYTGTATPSGRTLLEPDPQFISLPQTPLPPTEPQQLNPATSPMLMSQAAPVQQPYSTMLHRHQTPKPSISDLTRVCVCQAAPVQQPYSSLLPFEEPEPLPGRLLASLASHEPVSPSHAGESRMLYLTSLNCHICVDALYPGTWPAMSQSP